MNAGAATLTALTLRFFARLCRFGVTSLCFFLREVCFAFTLLVGFAVEVPLVDVPLVVVDVPLVVVEVLLGAVLLVVVGELVLLVEVPLVFVDVLVPLVLPVGQLIQNVLCF